MQFVNDLIDLCLCDVHHRCLERFIVLSVLYYDIAPLYVRHPYLSGSVTNPSDLNTTIQKALKNNSLTIDHEDLLVCPLDRETVETTAKKATLNLPSF